MQGIYIPETKNVSVVYIVTAILWLQFMLRVMLFFHVECFVAP
jgi:hypothetical protein